MGNRTTLRKARQEQEITSTILEVVFSATSPEQLTEGLRARVAEAPRFRALPRYRQDRVDAYTQGVLDALARLYAQPGSPAPVPSSLPPAHHVPKRVRDLQPSSPGLSWRRHARGGGWVSSTAEVAPTVYVGPEAAVFDTARVFGDVRIFGAARVCGSAVVQDRARIHGDVRVGGTAVIRDDARVISGALVVEGEYGAKAILRGPLPERPRVTTLPPPPPAGALAGGVSPLAQFIGRATN